MKNRKKVITILIVVIILIAAALAFILWPRGNKQVEVKVINKIEAYNYVLEDNEISLHKDYFNELIDVLKEDNVNEEDYASLVVKLFISDFYNLDNKTTKNDVGGIQYIYTSAKDNMVLKAKDTIYKYVESNIDNTRKQELPVIKEITIDDIKQIEFENETSNKIDEEAYEIKATWVYKEDLGYQSEAIFRLMHEDKKLSIVEIEEIK